MEENKEKKILYEEICSKIGMLPIDKKILENHLRCAGHVQRRTINALSRKYELIQVERTEKNGRRAQIMLVKLVKNDMTIKKVIKSMTKNRIE